MVTFDISSILFRREGKFEKVAPFFPASAMDFFPPRIAFRIVAPSSAIPCRECALQFARTLFLTANVEIGYAKEKNGARWVVKRGASCGMPPSKKKKQITRVHEAPIKFVIRTLHEVSTFTSLFRKMDEAKGRILKSLICASQFTILPDAWMTFLFVEVRGCTFVFMWVGAIMVTHSFIGCFLFVL